MESPKNTTSNDKITVQELERLRVLTFRQGIVTEPQIAHLKIWMLAAASHIQPKDLTIEVNTETYHVNYVMSPPKFKVNRKKGAKTAAKKKTTLPKDFEKKCSSVAAWVQFLFGHWWSVQFTQNNKPLYLVPAREKAPEDTAKKLRAVVAKDDVPDYGHTPHAK
jgi:hypothetical protein